MPGAVGEFVSFDIRIGVVGAQCLEVSACHSEFRAQVPSHVLPAKLALAAGPSRLYLASPGAFGPERF